MLKDIFSFAEYLEKGTYGLGHKLTLTRNTDKAVLIKVMQSTLVKLKLML